MMSPLKLRNSIFGFICVTGRKSGRPYEYSDFQLLEMLAQQVADNVNYLKLWHEYKDKQIIETELALTARIQREILPRVFPVKTGFDIAARSIPARLVGGDFFDFIPTGRGKYLLIMADVSGKGLSACVFMAISRSILRAQLDHVNDPALILELANRRIFEESISGMFVTCFCCIVNTAKRTLTFSNAGHLAQYLLRKEKDDMEQLHTQGRPLGVMSDSSYSSRTIGFGGGDILFLFTDGLTETLNNCFEEYGEERLISVLKRSRNCPSCSSIAEKVIEDHSRFKGSAEMFDDITLMAVRFES
jgi:serine phosphatase RsbU (regulator of sigma subunit)